MTKQSGWKQRSKENIKEIFEFCEGYKGFLDLAKTEREAARLIENTLIKKGFNDDFRHENTYMINKGKTVFAFMRGKSPLTEGLNIIAAHIDAPRLDLKQNPLFEDVDLALLRTHYYGGIKKYQWVAIPLALHGVVIKADGTKIELSIGEEDSDPVFVIDDLLPHLSRKAQDEKKLSEAIEGEKLAVLFGSIPLVGVEKEGVKKGILKLLHDRYGIMEDDFISAELEVVPAFKARDVGIDRSMIGAYGQDDRACAYTLLEAFCDTCDPGRSCLAIFTDKEEIGSEGDTGMQSNALQIFLYNILEGMDLKADEVTVRKMLFKSRAVSADVNGPVNPMYQDVHEKQNACYLGRGICVTKFTGHGGKGGASDAHAEYVGEIRRLFDREDILWQTGELGKIDQGGGGTVAKHLAVYGMDIIDCGTPILTMHSPFEVSSKLDVYETYRAFHVFFKS
ncbi:MAG: aminopeptidase [Proteobacteria bacterium]|nr:aminopeptidase [Pseudomonadota bacterium]